MAAVTPTPTAGSRRRPVALAALAVVALALVGAHLAHPGGGLGEATYLTSLGLAAAVAWVGAVGSVGPDRRAWFMIAVGVIVSATADLTYVAIGWVAGTTADVSVADALWLASYGALALGLLRLAPGGHGGHGRWRSDVDAVIDSLVPAVIALLVLWVLVLGDLASDSSTSAFTRAVWMAYPVLDVVLLALLVRLAVVRNRSSSPALALLGVSLVCWLAADLGYLFATGDSAVTWLDVGWMAASLLLGGSVLARRLAGPPELLAARPHPGRMWLVMVPLLVPAAIEVHGFARGEDANPFVLGAATAALVGLASLRGHRLLQAAERARQELQAGEAHFRALAANSADAVLVVDGQGCVAEAAGNLERLVGPPTEEAVGTPVTRVVGSADPDALEAYLGTVRVTAPGTVAEHEIEVRHAGGDLRWLAVRLVNLVDDPAVGGIVAHLQDVTDRRRAQDELAHQAFHDALTGLANHALFSDRIAQALRRTARTGADVAVLYLDVDGFKTVNDRFGHDTGDRVIAEVAARLRGTVRTADTVARLGGDEFGVLIEENHDADEARTTADRILQALSVPIDVDGQLIAVSASIGVAVADVASAAADVIRSADIAMYRAKGARKGRTVVYDAQMGAEAGDALRMETDLPGVVDRGELVLHYQPVVALEDRRLTGFEALARWRHPELGLVLPDRFIPVAEQTGQIVAIGRWVLETACAAAAGWCGSGDGPPLTMAVNLTAVQLADDRIVDDVRHALRRSGLDPSLLVVEMTETSLVADPAGAAARLAALRDLGVRLAIDDFGTGYSSLSYLRQFPIDILKIDRSFVDTITAADRTPPIVRGLLDLARTLDLEIIAEGIETEAQHRRLRQEHCAVGQGFHFARPMPAPEVDRLLRRAAVGPSSWTQAAHET